MILKKDEYLKGTSFVNLRDAGNPLELAQRYNDQSADELVFLDITASKEKRGTKIWGWQLAWHVNCLYLLL
ncbi:MAG: hypothetical protein CM1200mP30_31810 [Pseudomonadota bacterium]|nr:MAG: hypothetical protein CM1200mP30_31810 [Pseudomonadota bacterium]